MTLKLAWNVLSEILAKWTEHKAVRLAAALAYYGIFAMAPVLMIAHDSTAARAFASQMTPGQNNPWIHKRGTYDTDIHT